MADNMQGVQCVPDVVLGGQIWLCRPVREQREARSQVEGLVRDNRVEVRVLFGASRKAPHLRGFLVMWWRASAVIDAARNAA